MPAGTAGCDGDPHLGGRGGEQWRVASSWGLLDSDLRLEGRRVDIDSQTFAVAVARTLGNRNSFGLVVGAAFRGELRDPESMQRWEMSPGPLIAAQLAREWLGANRARLFLTSSLSFAFSAQRTREQGGTRERATYYASDLRLAVQIGTTLWGRVSPYAGAVAFGGPISWERSDERASGSDPDHHSLLLGIRLRLPERFDAGFEWAYEGARGLSASVGYSF